MNFEKKRVGQPRALGQATIEFVLVLPLIFVLAMCLVQLAKIAQGQLILDYVTRNIARKLSLADVQPFEMNRLAEATIVREFPHLESVVDIQLTDTHVLVRVAVHEQVSIPIIGRFFDEINFNSTAEMPLEARIAN